MVPKCRNGPCRRLGTISGVALLITVLLIGLLPVPAASSTAGHSYQTPITSSCSNPPTRVAFFGLDTTETPAIPVMGRATWDSNTISIGYDTTGPMVGFFVVSNSSGAILGVEPVDASAPVHVDGIRIDLNSSLTGVRTVQVDWYCDANGNGELDPASDSPAGARAGPTRIDFNATFNTANTPVETADWIRTPTEPIGTETPSTSESNPPSTPGQPGFTSLLSLITIVTTALLLRRETC